MFRALLVIVVAVVPADGWAQLPDETLEPVALNATQNVVVLRYAMTFPGQAPTVLELYRFDLASNRLVETIPLIRERDGHPASARAQAWRAAETRLIAEGAKFSTSEFRRLPPTTPRVGEYLRVRVPSVQADVVLKKPDQADDGNSLVPLDLFVNERLVRRDVVRVVASGGNGLQGLYEVGGVLLGVNLVDETRSGAFSIPLEELRQARCPSLDVAVAEVLAQRAALARGWSLKRVGEHLEATGPQVERTRCADGDSANDFTCTNDRGPARLLVQIAPSALFQCGPEFQRHQDRRSWLPRFESACFTYVVRPPLGVSYADGSLLTALDPLLKGLPGLAPGTRTCPGF